jgi:steroid delta-isomerase-like uncharacterized protein
MRTNDEHIGARISAVEAHLSSENLHDVAAIMQTFGPEARYDDEAWAEHHEGRAAVQAYYEGLLRAVPDLAIDVRRRHVTDEHIILEVEISGTHEGVVRTLPGTGRRIAFPLCAVYSFDAEHRLAGEKIYYDRAMVFRQLGIYREPTSLLGRVTLPLLHPITLTCALFRRWRKSRRKPLNR